MFGYRRDLLGDRDIQHNQGITESYVDDAYNRWRIGPAGWASLLNGAAIARVGTGSHSALDLPKNGLISAAFAERSKAGLWSAGNLRVSFIYTSDVGSTNAFVVGGTISPVAQGGNLNVAGQTLASVAIPGPAVAYTEMKWMFADLVPLNAQHRMIGVKPTRMSANASDTNANHLYVLELIVEFVSAEGH